jgi:hypothetical protein
MVVGCGNQENQDPGTEVVEKVYSLASSGGHGGHGGSVVLYYRESSTDPESGTFALGGGAGAPGGNAEVGQPGSYGVDGQAGELEINRDPDFEFDPSDVSPDQIIEIGDSNVISVEDLLDPLPPLRLEILRVAAGSELEIGCDVRIKAKQFIIEQGGRLTLRQREGANCSIAVGRSLDTVAGLRGSLVYIQAEVFQLDGILDISGNPASPGKPGGNGGKLTLRVEQFGMGPEAEIRATGGAGGTGVDEQPVTRD